MYLFVTRYYDSSGAVRGEMMDLNDLKRALPFGDRRTQVYLTSDPDAPIIINTYFEDFVKLLVTLGLAVDGR